MKKLTLAIVTVSLSLVAIISVAQFDSEQMLIAQMEGYCTRTMVNWRNLAREHDLDISDKYHEDCMDKQRQAVVFISQLMESNDERRLQRIVEERYANDGNMLMLLFDLEFALSGDTFEIRYNSQAIPYPEHDLPTGY